MRLRWDMPNTHKPTAIECDAMFWCATAVPFHGLSLEHGPLGGSETEVIWCAEALASRGKSVIVATNARSWSRTRGVTYVPLGELGITYEANADTLVVLRYGSVPKVEHKQLVCWATDMPDGEYRGIVEALEAEGGTLVCVSEWQASLFPESTRKVVIHNGLPHLGFASWKPKQPGRWVYASAAQKGLDATLRLWLEIRKHGRDKYAMKGADLLVCSPGYDDPKAAAGVPNVQLVGGQKFTELCHTIASAQGIFYVNVMPETFGIVGALAEALGTPCFALCLNGVAGLREAVASPTLFTDADAFVRAVRAKDPGTALAPPRDFSWSTIVEKWLQLLNQPRCHEQTHTLSAES